MVKFPLAACLVRGCWLVLLLITQSDLHASNLERELRIRDEIIDSIVIGEAEMLEADGQEFLGIYTESELEKAQGAVIIMHGRGLHPYWVDVTRPLRQDLPEYGWHTLSIQMPVLEMGKEQRV